ncbi:MAG: S1-like domain-containing RNA-binding protein [Lachnospiraceae bacterium]
MLELGKIQELIIVKKVDYGVYLSERADDEQRVLLPAKQVPKDAEIGQHLTVFLYKDSEDRLIATIKEPKIRLGQTAVLTVAQVGKIGAFMDWGLEKDLLLPFKQQTKKVNEGEECLVALYIDKSGRLCLTMNVYEYLRTDSDYHTGDQVTGRVYLISEQFGAFVAVDDCYSALIPQKELYGDVRINRMITGRITEVKEDGKLTLSIREKSYIQMDKDAERVIQIIEAFDGVLPFNDKASPEVIKRECNMSKNEFKRAVGRLYKEHRIEITEKSIRIVQNK